MLTLHYRIWIFRSWWSLFDHKIVITVVSAEIEIKGEKIWGMKKFRNCIKMKALKSKPIRSIELYWIVSQLCYIHVVLLFLLTNTKIDKDIFLWTHWCVLMFTVRKNYIWMRIKLCVSSIIQSVQGCNFAHSHWERLNVRNWTCGDILFCDCSINADKDRSTLDLSSITLLMLTNINWMKVESFSQN